MMDLCEDLMNRLTLSDRRITRGRGHRRGQAHPREKRPKEKEAGKKGQGKKRAKKKRGVNLSPFVVPSSLHFRIKQEPMLDLKLMGARNMRTLFNR